MRCLRKAVSSDKPHVDLIIELGFIEKVMALFDVPLDRVLYETAWIITNIAANKEENCELLLKNGCVKILIGLLDFPNADVAEQVILTF